MQGVKIVVIAGIVDFLATGVVLDGDDADSLVAQNGTTTMLLFVASGAESDEGNCH